MITCLSGDFGSGKTTALLSRIAEDVRAGRSAILLVPEQQTVSAEQMMAELLPPEAPLVFEVSNFTRLANTVFRRLGGLSYRYADLGTRTLCMWRTMGELLPLLHEKEGELELGRVRKMTAAMRELSALSITPTQLSQTAARLADAPRLREKLEDLSLISTLYHAILHEKYDDTADDLDRLCALLTEGDPLRGTHIYLDGFISFTEQQWHVLRALAPSCDLTVTLDLPKAREDNPVFLETKGTHARLLRLAERAGVPFTRTDLGAPKRAKSPLLTEALCSLFSEQKEEPVCSESAKASEKTDSATPPLRLLRAPDAMSECEWIASDITRRVMEEGAHYRDFAIIARRAEQYVGVLDTVFAAAGIPVFLSKHTDISTYAAIKLIYTAYAICTANWRQGDVISYCKCGLSGLSQEDIDIFEIYVTRWKLSGHRFTMDEPWTMNPDGYAPTVTQRGANILSRVEGVRRALLDQLAPLAESCRRQSVREHARALYEFLCSLDLENKLKARAEEARVSRNTAEADELSRLFGVICDALDRLVDSVGDTVVGADGFVDLLRLLFGEVTLSRIPASLDEVTVGSADLIRIGRAKHIYLIGVNEGEFPAPATEDSVFSEGDRRTLSALGLSIEPDLLPRAARELFCFARAFSAASESVSVVYADKTLGGSSIRPAACLFALAERFSLPVTDLSSLSPLDSMYARGLCEDRLGILQGSVEGQALAEIFAEDKRGEALLSRLAYPLASAECRLSPETANSLYGESIHLTQSRIDRFTACPFSYFCQYVLRLDAAKVIEFDYSDIGNLLHTVLERLFGRLSAEKKTLADMEEAELLSIVDDLLADYVRSICPSAHQRTARMAHLLRTLRRALLPVVQSLYEEFSQSEFLPTFFEMDISSREGDAPGAIPYTLPNGTPIAIHGRIDRVDTWHKDGKTYLRVVDYKSGKKSFSLADIERGLNTQLLVYLFSLWKSENPAFRDRLGGGELLPAGALYTAARAEEGLYDSPCEATHAAEDAKASVYRSGLLLDDREVLEAMDPGLSGRFIPIREKKDGAYYAVSLKSLASLEAMGELVGKLDRVICRIGADLQSGEASARPLASPGRRLLCEHCDMAPVCRSSKK